MPTPKISREWEEFAATNPDYIDHSAELSEVRTKINQQSLKNISLLKEPELAVLVNNVNTKDSTITLPEVPGHEFRIRVYSPVNPESKHLPVMLYFHSGYWSTGNLDGDELGCRAMIAHGNDLLLISFEYRLAPENTWETIFSDAENALKWTHENASHYGGDISEGIFVGGATAGAHLAAITAIRTRHRTPKIKIAGQCLIVPITIAWTDVDTLPKEWTSLVTSHVENAQAPLLSERSFQRYLSVLDVPDAEQRKGENFPVWANLKSLPPTYLAMDGPDPLRDEGYLYEKLLREAGVRTRTDHYEMPNWFVQFPQLPTTGKAGMELAAGVRWLLQVSKYTL